MKKKRRAKFYLPTCTVHIVPREWLRRKPWFYQYLELNKMRGILARMLERNRKLGLSEAMIDNAQQDSLIIYESPNKVRPELFGVYYDDDRIIYLIMEASPEQREVSLNKFLALHLGHTRQNPEDFYAALNNSEEYKELVQNKKQKSFKTRARLNYDHN